ncbi:MAG TPA: ribonuclease T2 [Acidobacteriaceae bacterium]|nr:ribonuclease T2 [Acidobacteriaceae bacterium]
MKVPSNLQIRTVFPCLCIFGIVLLAGCSRTSNPEANRSRGSNSFPAGEMRAATQQPAAAEAAPDFDYYLLTLSWSPEYCHGHSNSPECNGSHPGFVVHGLWPQRNNGQWPSHCSNAPGLPNPSTMLDIMPDPHLVAHEWATHGTCSGLTARQYFALVRQAFQSIRIPAPLTGPTQSKTMSATALKQSFTEVNSGMAADDIAISCHNRYLSAVEFCLSKDLHPIACQAVRDCTARSIRIPGSGPMRNRRRF